MISLFGIQFGNPFPSTIKVEEQRKKLEMDFRRYSEISQSDLLKRYNELVEIVNSGGYIKRVDEFKAFKYKNSITYRKKKQLDKLSKTHSIIIYLQVHKKHQSVAELMEIIDSEKVQRYKELKNIVTAKSFVKKTKQKDFMASPDFALEEEYKILLLDSSVERYIKEGTTKLVQEYYKVRHSAEIKEYNSLLEEVNSPEFKSMDADYSDKHRYKNSEEYSQLKELEELKKREEIIWYLQQKPSRFNELTDWKLTFDDDFDDQRLNKQKWITSYYWGQAMLNDSYVTVDDKQIFKEKNVILHDGYASLKMVSEIADGKIWDAEKGFYSSKFNYTGGMINNGHAFRQSSGKIEAKVRYNSAKEATLAMWLCGETNTPHINVFKSIGKKGNQIEVGKFTKKSETITSNIKVLPYKNLGETFHIYTIEWNKEKITWKINGIIVLEQTDNLPTENLYLNFSSHLKEEISTEKLPISMDIDWVRCYIHV